MRSTDLSSLSAKVDSFLLSFFTSSHILITLSITTTISFRALLFCHLFFSFYNSSIFSLLSVRSNWVSALLISCLAFSWLRILSLVVSISSIIDKTYFRRLLSYTLFDFLRKYCASLLASLYFLLLKVARMKLKVVCSSFFFSIGVPFSYESSSETYRIGDLRSSLSRGPIDFARIGENEQMLNLIFSSEFFIS